jgi:hypothetical protein
MFGRTVDRFVAVRAVVYAELWLERKNWLWFDVAGGGGTGVFKLNLVLRSSQNSRVGRRHQHKSGALVQENLVVLGSFIPNRGRVWYCPKQHESGWFNYLECRW